MKIIFSGGEAENNRLDAYEGLKSVEGLIRVARIATHYAATNEVRFRAPYTDVLSMQLIASHPGSFEMVFDNIAQAMDSNSAQRVKAISAALIQRLTRRGTGQASGDALVVDGETIPSGDIDAMAEASEAGLKAAHRWIDSTSKKITLSNSGGNTELDTSTREYVETEVDGEETTKDVSVAALNVNSRNGRVYFNDEKRTVPFLVHRDAEARTMPNLSKYLNEYALKTGEKVNIRYRPFEHIDGRTKRIVIYDCYDVADAA
ncbi:hypothetical protein [Erythrobacter aureus]|uniref:DUF7946 domain-containing protein n=1 Tax=Erythrobacter aureus TaxID=2182384 RepID=UPI003A8E93E1